MLFSCAKPVFSTLPKPPFLTKFSTVQLLTKLCAVSLLQGFVVEILMADLSYCCVSEKCKLASIQVCLEEVPGLKA